MAGGRTMARWLRRGIFGLAGLLALAVVLAPLLEGGLGAGAWARILALFAHDTAVRRTSLASAAGLVVTACVFFGAPPRGRRP
jgi:hypothetical protein